MPVLKFYTNLLILAGKQIVNFRGKLRSVVMKPKGQGPYNHES